MGKHLAGVFIFLWAASVGAQDTSSSADIESVETYGNCTVFDQVDMLTDKVSHIMRCMESTITDVSEISFLVEDDGTFGLALSKGVQFHLDDTIEIAVRVDRRELRTGEWTYSTDGSYAISAGRSALFSALLTEIANGERVAMRVGQESGNVRLDGAREAVADFVQRIEHIQLTDY